MTDPEVKPVSGGWTEVRIMQAEMIASRLRVKARGLRYDIGRADINENVKESLQKSLQVIEECVDLAEKKLRHMKEVMR